LNNLKDTEVEPVRLARVTI